MRATPPHGRRLGYPQPARRTGRHTNAVANAKAPILPRKLLGGLGRPRRWAAQALVPMTRPSDEGVTLVCAFSAGVHSLHGRGRPAFVHCCKAPELPEEVPISDAWRTISSRLAWFGGDLRRRDGVLRLPPVRHPGRYPSSPAETFVDDLLASFEHQQAHWIEDLGSSLGLAAGFVGLALLGAPSPGVGHGHPRGAILA